MKPKLTLTFASFTALSLAGCAAAPTPAPIVAVALPPVVTPVAPPRPPGGASANLVIPAALPDGSYPTPNKGLSEAAAIWHLRVALNVAALGCRGPNDALLIAGYNKMLADDKSVLAGAEKKLAAEYRASGGTDWRDAYDDSMTRLYNFFAQPPAQPDFCAAAQATLGALAATPPASLARYAVATLPTLDQPFVDFYRAYDAYRRDIRSYSTVIAVNAAPPAPVVAPSITVDPAVFKQP